MKSNHKYFANRNIFPKFCRFLNKTDFRMSDGESVWDAPFKFVYKKREFSNHPSRLGIAVSKKYSKSAVKRNHAKRIIRESFRTSEIKNSGFDILAILSKPIKDNIKSDKEISNLIFRKIKHLEGRLSWAQTKKEH